MNVSGIRGRKSGSRMIAAGPTLALAALLLAVAAVAAVPLAAQAPEPGSFVVIGRGDTVAVETFTRTADRLDGELIGPVVGRLMYELQLGPASAVQGLTVRAWAPGSNPQTSPIEEVGIELRGASAMIESTSALGAQSQRVPMREGAMPYINPSFATMEQIIRRARALGGERVEVPVFLLPGGESVTASVTAHGADSVLISLNDTQIRAAVSPDGRLLGGSAPARDLTFTRLDGGLPPE